MCGIAGFDRSAGAVDVRSAVLLGGLRPRGPDGDFLAQRGRYALVQTRLAVVDLSDRVSYPLPNEDGDVWLLFNGEIYGHDVLRADLEALGHRFRTRCDAEVVVHGYEQWGVGVFRRLNGMFAVALLDERTGELVLARDESGTKPLVVGRREGGFAWASDALALVRAGLSAGEVDEDAVAEYLGLHYVLAPRTGLRDVEQVEPGTALVRDRRGGERTTRWAPERFAGPDPPADVGLDEVERTLHEAVERQMRADVPVGVFLSSGVDSALVLHYATAAGFRPHGYTIGFAGAGDYDEVAGARRLARAAGVEHTVETLDTSFLTAITDVGAAFDCPFGDASAIATLALARLARADVTVALSGTGGDDLFGGYHRHRAHKLRPLVAAVPRSARERLSAMRPPAGSERRSRVTLARSHLARLADAGGGSAAEQYLALIGSMTSAVGRSAVPVAQDAGATVLRRAPSADAAGGTPLRWMQQLEVRSHLPGDLLVKEDRATMAVGLEARVPFLDQALLDLADRTPDGQKVSIRRGKVVLREVVRRRVPAHARRVRKRGFAVPLHALFGGRWRSEAAAWFAGLGSPLVEGAHVARWIDEGSAPATDVWALAMLGRWERRLDAARSAAAAVAQRAASSSR